MISERSRIKGRDSTRLYVVLKYSDSENHMTDTIYSLCVNVIRN